MNSLDNHLYKASWVNYDDSDTVVIDNNELADQKIQISRDKDQQRRMTGQAGGEMEAPMDSPDAFAEGLDAQAVDPDAENVVEEAVPEGEAGPLPEVPEEPPASAVDLTQVQEQADAILAKAQEQADAILSDAQAKADEIRAGAAEEGRAEGHDEGYQAGLQEGQQEAESLKEDLQKQKEEQEQEYQKLVDTIEPEMVDVLTKIYEHVFSIEFGQDKEIILHLLRTTLGRLEGGGNLLVHVSSADYDMIMDEKEHLKELLTAPDMSMEIVEDPLLKENECTIETDDGVFDCGVGTELEELSRKLKLLSFDRSRNGE